MHSFFLISILSGMRLTDELKESTGTTHQAAEKKMVTALKQLRSKEEYIGFNDQRQKILSAACDTFTTFKSWTDRNDHPSQL